MLQSAPTAIYCINPDCPHPCQTWGNRFCQRCGSALKLRGRYLPLRVLGTGGFAVTYSIYDLQTRTEQVLKVLTETVPKARDLFRQEAAVLASLDHPGIPRVESDSYFEVVLEHPVRRSLPCLVMEKINGQTLQDILDQHPGGCPEIWVVNWFYQALDILWELHRHQIIHRDIKPANLMLRQATGQLVAIDFGGVKQLRTLPAVHFRASSTRLVSPGYSPPEQAVGGDIQPNTDLYALGRTLIHLLTSRYPADLEDPITGELRWRSLVSVNPALADLLDDLTRVNPQRRPASVEIVAQRLTRIVPYVPSQNGVTIAPTQQLISTLGQKTQAVRKRVVAIARAIASVVLWVFNAVVDTLWSAVLGTVGCVIGTAIGFSLAYRLPIGTQLARWLSIQLAQGLPNLPLTLEPGFLMFGLAGLGTALGLTAAGGYGQRRRGWVAGFLGILSYLVGWAGWQLTLSNGGIVGFAAFVAIAPALLTLGLGLRSHHLVHALVTAAVLTPFVLTLVVLDVEFTVELWEFLSTAFSLPASSDWVIFRACLLFFGLVSSALGIALGVSHYLFVPILRGLGWR